MPSLRRTLSSPAGRSSPYSHSASCTSTFASSSLSTRSGSRGPRRPSGSDTSERRVLQDIDWWRILEGQREVRGLASHEALRATTPASDEEELDQEEREPAPAAAATTPAGTVDTLADTLTRTWHNVSGAGADAFDDSASFLLDFSLGDGGSAEPLETPSPLTHFASLSVSPQGRSSFRRTPSISSTFSDASFSSSSSGSPFSTPSHLPMGFGLGFSDIITYPLHDDLDDEPPLSILPRRPFSAPAPRSVSYSFIESELSTSQSRFEDHTDGYSMRPFCNDDDWF